MIKNKVVKIIIPVLIGLVVLTGVYFFFPNLADNNGILKDNTSSSFEFEESQSKEEVPAGASGGIEIPGYSTITIPSGEKDVKVEFFNPESNKVYFELKLSLKDSGEEIYKSKLFSPGQHLYEIELNREIEKGQYDMVITYNTYAMDENFTPRNGATVNCILDAK